MKPILKEKPEPMRTFRLVACVGLGMLLVGAAKAETHPVFLCGDTLNVGMAKDKVISQVAAECQVSRIEGLPDTWCAKPVRATEEKACDVLIFKGGALSWIEKRVFLSSGQSGVDLMNWIYDTVEQAKQNGQGASFYLGKEMEVDKRRFRTLTLVTGNRTIQFLIDEPVGSAAHTVSTVSVSEVSGY